MLVSKGSTACDYWLGALAFSLDLAVLKSFGLSTAVCVISVDGSLFPKQGSDRMHNGIWTEARVF